MAFPLTARYFFHFRITDTGLTPVIRFRDHMGNPAFQRADTLAQVAPPAVAEVGGGRYYFDYTWTSAEAPDITAIIDGGASIPTPVERFIHVQLSARAYATPTSEGSGGGSGAIVIGG
jgi:hypothetical protein